MKTGTIMEATPTPRPTTSRPTKRQAKLGANANKSAPTMKTAEAKRIKSYKCQVEVWVRQRLYLRGKSLSITFRPNLSEYYKSRVNKNTHWLHQTMIYETP